MNEIPPTSPDLPVIAFESAHSFEYWLFEHHQESKGIWLKFYKKGSGIPTIGYTEAVDVALCYGWIDSQMKSLDEIAYLQRFGPRRAKSVWSKMNIARVERLAEQGRLKKAGLASIERARADGSWYAAYDAQSNMVIPEEFLEALSKNKEAHTFFQTLNRSNVFSIVFRLQTAKKPETKQKRIQQIIVALAKGEKFHG
jgi:uncharacterized protein YdeI (YjbR/CyaY-like superfamily)